MVNIETYLYILVLYYRDASLIRLFESSLDPYTKNRVNMIVFHKIKKLIIFQG